jgi:two-component system cell cycle response regulator DivK
MSKFAGKSAIIIEDDHTSIKVLEQLLKQQGVSTKTILDSSGVENNLESSNVPDVIFLDLEMPHMNGYQVLEWIQGQAKFEDVPVVAYTTHISHLNDAKRAGFHSFLGKPIDGRSFANQLERILDGESVWEVPS